MRIPFVELPVDTGTAQVDATRIAMLTIAQAKDAEGNVVGTATAVHVAGLPPGREVLFVKLTVEETAQTINKQIERMSNRHNLALVPPGAVARG